MSKAALARLYAELPTIECKGLCQAYCSNIPLSVEELQRIVHHRGGKPIPFAVYAPDADLFCIEPPSHQSCPLLREDGRCSVYQIRPIACRIWGLHNRCPFGCVPSRYLTEEETWVFLLRAGIAGEPLSREQAERAVKRMPAEVKRQFEKSAFRTNIAPGFGWIAPKP